MKIEPHIEAMLAQVELRVLYGPQAGSRLPLSSGNYLLGTGDECAVMLAGPRMRETHASLEFDGETPSITPVEGQVFDAQGNEIQGTLPMRLGMPVELGGVWISLDLIDSEWPDPEEVAAIAGLASPPPPQEEATDRHAEPTADTLATANSKKNWPAWVVTSAPFVVVALLGITTFGATAWLLQGQSAAPEARTPSEPKAETSAVLSLREALSNVVPGQNVIVTEGTDGSLRVAGYVRDSESRDKVVAAARKHGSVVTSELYVDSELLQATRRLVERNADPQKLKVKVVAVTNGRAELTGAVSNAAVRESLLERIRSEAPGISAVTGTLQTAEDLSTLMQEKILSAGLGGKLQIVERQPEFIVRGRLSADDLFKWERLLVDFSNDYASLLPIRATVAALYRSPPVDVQMIVGGHMPFIVTEGGQRIGRGGDANGHTLSTVGEQEIVFEGSERFRIAR